MGGNSSHHATSLIDSHTEGILYRRVSSFESSTSGESCIDEEQSQWHPIKCILEGQVFTYFELDDSLRCENTIPIDDDFLLESENHHTLEITLRLFMKETRAPARWILRAADMASFSVWSVVLKRAKRPKRSESATCQHCSRSFGLLRRASHCRSCGLSLCSDCCSRKGKLPHLGYHEPQMLCNRCIQLPLVRRANEEHLRKTRSWLLCDQE